MRSSWFSQLPLKYPPRQAEYFSFYSKNFPEPLRLSPLNNLAIGTPVPARLRAQGRESPRRLRMIAFHAPFAAAVRVIDRIHRYAAHRRPAAVPARAAGLSIGHVFVVEVSDLADGRHAIE